MYLEGMFKCGRKNGAPKTENKNSKSRKIMCEEACEDLLKYCVSFGGGLEFFNKINWEATEGRGYIGKCGETLF